MLSLVVRITGAFLAVVCFSIVLELPRKYLIPAGAAGASGWLVYLLIEWTGLGVLMAAFASSLVVAFLSHILARVGKAPVTVFLVAGILPMVPGTSIYRCVYYIIQDNSEFSLYYLVETLQIAGAIAVAIFIMDSMFRVGKQNW